METIMDKVKTGNDVVVVVNYKHDNGIDFLPFKDGVLGMYVDSQLCDDYRSYDADTALEMIVDKKCNIHVVDISDDPSYIECIPAAGIVVHFELYGTIDEAKSAKEKHGSFFDRYYRAVIDAKTMYVDNEIKCRQEELNALNEQHEALIRGEYAINVGVRVKFAQLDA